MRKIGSSSELSNVETRAIAMLCVGRLMDRLAHRQLMWLLDHHEALPCDTISDPIVDLDAPESAGHAAYVIFLDVYRAYDALPYGTIPNQFQALRFTGQVFNFIEEFFRSRFSL